ncbi:MAG: DNA modification methylase [Patescibacteria group bacterium]|nr:DNA modification methylase [Patescibacteria group bacterium]
MKKINPKIIMVPPAQLKAAEYNPRRLTASQEKVLTRSIETYQLLDPIVANRFKGRENVIISGHQRWKIAQKLNYKEVPVIFVNLNPKKEKDLNLLMNKAQGEWDLELLKNFEIETLLDVGFDSEEIGAIWNDVLEIEDDDFQEEKELEKIKETSIKTGDLFQLGSHRLLCADSTDQNNGKILLAGERASMVYCDSPYNISLDYAKGLGGKQNYGGQVNDNKTDAEFREFTKQAMQTALSVSKPDLHFFWYCDQKYVGMIQALYAELGIKYQRTCLWMKNGFNVTPQVAFNKCYEPVVYGIKNKPYVAPINNLNEILNKEIGTGNRTIEDILDLLDIWLVKRLPGQDYEHPTSKPPTLHEKALRRCTKINDIVLDLFGGSGSTLIACEQLKRRAYLIEKDQIFCQLIINRFEKLSGLRAKKLNKAKYNHEKS